MKLFFALLGALALSACATLTERFGLTADQQTCVAAAVASVVSDYDGELADLSWAQRAAFIDANVNEIAIGCGIDLDRFAALRSIETVLAAALEGEG
jgi:hypothetical protein